MGLAFSKKTYPASLLAYLQEGEEVSQYFV
ncbi:hypothetical protein clem_09125 [Legionella clemsonensis]|uniref:Uncharacterized protein n=1 Tax=Legionella clemsonensis TaxID=1867846 RepID=A0A222P3F7_9GAMM|nr:hypothetical protein clem_09125 [Legionella clemsonensis]